jgi:hypothetical protein
MNWIEKCAAIIRKNLAWSPIPLAMKEQVVAEALEAFQNPPAPEEKKKPAEDDPLVRGERLSALRERAHRWGGWESWKN